MSRAAVFLDRDGVLVEEVFYPRTGEREAPLAPSDVRLLPGAAAAVRRLAKAGFFLVSVSNQSAYAKGKVELASLWQVHDRFVELLAAEDAALHEYYYSWSHPDGRMPHFSGTSLERKPSPYFVLLAAARYDLSLPNSWMVGDRETDVRCGRAAGIKTIRVLHAPKAAPTSNEPDFYATGLLEAAATIEAFQV